MIISFLTLTTYAQEVIEVKHVTLKMSEGMQPSYQVEIPQAPLKTTQQNWVKKLQENIKVKIAEMNGEWVLAGVVKHEFTKDTVSIYSVLIEKENKIILNVFVKIDSVFFSPLDDKTELSSDKTDHSIRNYIRNFAVSQYKLAVDEELAATQKILKDLESDLNKLVKEQDNLKKDISSLENNIEKTERSITSLDHEIELKQQEIISHKSSMLSLVLEEDKKIAQEKDKTLTKEMNKLEKDRTKAKNDISDMKSKIEKNENAVKDNDKLQEEKQSEISAQKQVVVQVQAILDGIK